MRKDGIMLPTEEDINVYNSLDEQQAVKHFLNKTLEQAEAMFRDNSAYYQEDLMWMGPKAFQFYLQAVINYIKSDYSIGDSQIISALNAIIKFRFDEVGFSLAIDKVRDLVDYVINHYEKFDINSDVYGDLLGEYRQLQTQLQDL
jgi:hypothetical protein